VKSALNYHADGRKRVQEKMSLVVCKRRIKNGWWWNPMQVDGDRWGGVNWDRESDKGSKRFKAMINIECFAQLLPLRGGSQMNLSPTTFILLQCWGCFVSCLSFSLITPHHPHTQFPPLIFSFFLKFAVGPIGHHFRITRTRFLFRLVHY